MIASYEKIKMKGFLIPLLLLVTLFSFASADVIIFKDGRKIETERAWEEEGKLSSAIRKSKIIPVQLIDEDNNPLS